jgi:mannose-6-phosphate isomerase-like protein (cupin superfamily)
MIEKEYEQSWKERGYSFGVGSVTLEKVVAEAVHEDQDELVVVVNGKLKFTLDNDSFIAACDTEVFIPAKSIHSIKNIGTEASKIYYGYKSTEA